MKRQRAGRCDAVAEHSEKLHRKEKERERERKKENIVASWLDTSLWLLVFTVTLVARCSPGIFPRDKRDYCLALFADRSDVTCASTCMLFFIDRPHQRATSGDKRERDGRLKLRVHAFLGNASRVA